MPSVVRPPCRSRSSWPLRVSLTDSIHWRIQPIDPCRGASSRRSGPDQGSPKPAVTGPRSPAREALVPDQRQSRPQGAGAPGVGEQLRGDFAFADLGAGQAPGDGHPVGGGDQVQLQPPVPARVRRAVAVVRPSGQLGPLDRLPRGAARHRGGIDQPHRVVPARRLRGPGDRSPRPAAARPP